MNLWHLTPDATRLPGRVSSGERVALQVGTWPVEWGQYVWIEYRVTHRDGATEAGQATATWQHNLGSNSYWQAGIGPFAEGDRIDYTARGSDASGDVTGPTASFTVGPKLYLALLWHQHQPIYKNTDHPTQSGSYIHPWVRLHALRDYYSMASLVAEHPGLHLTINLTPSLLWQLEDYTERGACDRALELSLKPAESLTNDERKYILRHFFEADWHHQISPHPRYRDLFIKRRGRELFSIQDLRDLQMWFNLAWFGKEFREGKVSLATGKIASVRRFVEQGRDYTAADVEAMVAEQFKIMRAVIPIHRQLQAKGQIEVSTTPFFHPLLPLLVDTDRATIDRPRATKPVRFAHPEDADAQVQLAVEFYRSRFSEPPRGMWPAEGAVSQFVIPFFAGQGVRWVATDRGVLARSGRWGYEVNDPEVLCQPYRVSDGDASISIFFRDTQLSDAIGFYYHGYENSEEAARDFINRIKERFAYRLESEEDRVLTVVLDGENAWGAYREDAKPFLHALYRLLESDAEIRTVTFSEYLEGNPARGIRPHPPDKQARVYDLFTGSWIDESASALGVDLGTWVGEAQENRGWELLGQAREFLTLTGATPQSAPAAFQALYIAEGSDWFWWFGEDQDSGNDHEFDDLFRLHLKNVYRLLEATPPAELDRHIVPHSVIWTHASQVDSIHQTDLLTVRTHCPGRLNWIVDDRPPQSAEMQPVGGVMAGVNRHQLTIGPFPDGAAEVIFTFECTHVGCPGTYICCDPRPYQVRIETHQVIA
jgi:alpha-amylase/alpha-mannosidase (GH57 family)